MNRRPGRPLSRRLVLRGAGTIAIALPWLEAGGPPRARAAGAPASRFVTVYTPGGTVLDKWRPTGSETDFTPGPILAPLAPVQSKLLVLDGIDMKSGIGEQHQAGIVGWLTGTPQSATRRDYADGPSIDQVIANRISRGKKAKASIQMAVRWATGNAKGMLSPMNVANYEDNARFNPIPPRLDPQEIWTDLFGSPVGNEGALRLERKKSILDFVDRRYAALAARLGAADKARIEQHLTKLREVEQGLAKLPPGGGACLKAPARVDTRGYDPRAGFMSSTDTGAVTSDAIIPKVGRFLTDMLVMALACDLTAVASLQWSDTEAKHTFPWLDLPEHHHFYQHDGGFRPAECEKIYTWYSQQHAYLLQQMDAVDMGGHTLLDESVVFFGSEIQDPPSHNRVNVPFLLAGGGGGLRGGRWVKYRNPSHNDLLVSILNLFGDTRQTFGDPKFCTGPLPGLV
jgi:hypothetical protein